MVICVTIVTSNAPELCILRYHRAVWSGVTPETSGDRVALTCRFLLCYQINPRHKVPISLILVVDKYGVTGKDDSFLTSWLVNPGSLWL